MPLTAVIAYQVLPEADGPQVADHDPPDTVPVVVTTVPVAIVTSDAADVEGEARSRTAQLAV